MVKIMESPIKMDYLGVPLFLETSRYIFWGPPVIPFEGFRVLGYWHPNTLSLVILYFGVYFVVFGCLGSLWGSLSGEGNCELYDEKDAKPNKPGKWRSYFVKTASYEKGWWAKFGGYVIRWGNIVVCYMGVSKNKGTSKSWILIGFSIINHSFWGTPIFGNTHIMIDGVHRSWYRILSIE